MKRGHVSGHRSTRNLFSTPMTPKVVRAIVSAFRRLDLGPNDAGGADAPVLDHDVNRRPGLDGVMQEHGVVVDLTGDGLARLVVVDRGWQRLNAVVDLLYSGHARRTWPRMVYLLVGGAGHEARVTPVPSAEGQLQFHSIPRGRVMPPAQSRRRVPSECAR